jgi:hypothetical protein
VQTEKQKKKMLKLLTKHHFKWHLMTKLAASVEHLARALQVISPQSSGNKKVPN